MPPGMKHTPIVDDQNIAATPLMSRWATGRKPVLHQAKCRIPALVDSFHAAGVVPKKAKLGGQDRGVEGTPPVSHEYRSGLQETPFFLG